MILKLVQLGDYGQIEHLVEGKECVIGREPSCHIRPDHGKVANRHCRLYWFGPRLMIEDLNTAIGTGVNGVEIEGQPVELNDFDDISAGPVHFLVMITPTHETMAARTPAWVAGELARRGSKRASDSNIVSPIMQTARDILSRLVEDEGKPVANPAHHGQASDVIKKRGLAVSDEQGVALAKVLDRSLIEENEIRVFQRELDNLIDNGRSNIALHFGNVEHLSSQALSTVLKAQQRCRDVGGLLKICKVNPQVAELLRMTNIQRHIEVYSEEGPAIDSSWPKPEPGASPTTTAVAAPVAPSSPRNAQVLPASAPTGPVELVVEIGKARGQVVPVRTSKFVIGRDRRCQLRPNSDTISRVHAIIEQRDGKVFVRDYGTKNGTVVNGQTLRGEERMVKDGDRLQVGVLQFQFRMHPNFGPLDPTNEDSLAAWLLDQEHTDADAPTAMLNTMPGPLPGEEATKPSEGGSVHHTPLAEIACEVISGVQVVRIRHGDLDDESTVGPLRYELHTLFDQTANKRIVLSLENVRYLSSRAVGAILAFFQRLDREGGALRVCCVSPAILPVLDQMRLSRLVNLYASVEEAVSDPWI
jgi:anti-anti-sigma factor